MKTNILLFFTCTISLFNILPGLSQYSTDSTIQPKNAIYLEAGGIGGWGSINFDRAFYHKNKWSFIGRTGFGTYHLVDSKIKFNPDIIIPLSFMTNYGRKNRIELGFGQTFSSIVHNISGQSERVGSFHSHFVLGYKLQPIKQGLMIRINYYPILEFNRTFRHWFGFSFGYTF